MSDRPPTDFTIRHADWLDVADATVRVLASATPLEPQRVPLLDALGRALAEDLSATATLPPWDNSAMDGYAVRGDDVSGASPARPVALEVVGLTHAGDTPHDSLESGQAVRIMTGAPVPTGADSVVRVEDTDAEEANDGKVRILRDRDVGRNVRPAGEDMRVGEAILAEGDPVHPGTVGVLAAMGRDHVFVRRRPVVAILSTGDELLPPERYDEVRAGSGVPESNGVMLAASAMEAGAEPRLLGIAPDDREALREALRRGLDADALVTIGGASMGEADLVKRVLDEEGYEQSFWRVTMRPGTPFGFGHLPRDGRPPLPVFGLPGNPASAYVTFEIFVRPFLLRLAGHRAVHRPRMRCVAGETITATAKRTVFLRATVDGTATPPRVRLTGPQGSGLVRSLGRADGLAIVPVGVERIEVGEPLEVLLLGAQPVAPSTDAGTP